MFKLPAGRYLITDPCYTVEHEDWENHLLPKIYECEAKEEEEMEVKGRKYIIFSTYWGDGEYPVVEKEQKHVIGSFSVDAGLMCITEATDDLVDYLYKKYSGETYVIITMLEDFNVYEEAGRMYIGDEYVVDTQGDYMVDWS